MIGDTGSDGPGNTETGHPAKSNPVRVYLPLGWNILENAPRMKFIHHPETGGKVNGPFPVRSLNQGDFPPGPPPPHSFANLTPRSIGQYGRKRRWTYPERPGLRIQSTKDRPGQSFFPFMEPNHGSDR